MKRVVVLVATLVLVAGVGDAAAACPGRDGRASHEERSAARVVYEASWTQEDWRFGVDGSESPYLRFTRHENREWAAHVWPGSPAAPLLPSKVIVGPAAIELTACRSPWAYKMRLHEWAHVFQSAETWRSPFLESAARSFAHAVLGDRSWNPWLERGQFGCAWGVPPRLLSWTRRIPATDGERDFCL